MDYGKVWDVVENLRTGSYETIEDLYRGKVVDSAQYGGFGSYIIAYVGNINPGYYRLLYAELNKDGGINRHSWGPLCMEIDRRVRVILSEFRGIDSQGWHQSTVDELRELVHLFRLIIEGGWARDVDGDLPLSFDVVDRTKKHKPYFLPIPHLLDDNSNLDRAISNAAHNVRVAAEGLDMLIRTKNHMIREENDE